PLLAAVHCRDDARGIDLGADVVDEYLWLWRIRCRFLDDDLNRWSMSSPGALEPVADLLGIADRGGQSDSLHVPSRKTLNALEDREEMPPAILGGEGVQLVDDDGPDVREERAVVHGSGDQHRFDRLGCREQHIGPFREDATAFALPDVPVPKTHGSP